jgi:hypothetical protein
MISISKLVRLVFLETLILVFSIFSCLLCIPHANAASVTLAWNPNTEPDVAGYRLYYGKASGTYESAIDVGNQTTYSISGFIEGVDYYFAVTAYNADGFESAFSDEVSYPGPLSVTISLATDLNLISLPIEPLNPSISALTENLSPCLIQILTYKRDTEGNDIWLYYDPYQLELSTLSTLESGSGYWVEMTCPGEMTVVGNRTTKPVTLTSGLNLVGYNGLIPLPISIALSSIANQYTSVYAYKDGVWLFYYPGAEAESTLKEMIPGSGYWIEVTEETSWVLP